jgi:hypothetical protein
MKFAYTMPAKSPQLTTMTARRVVHRSQKLRRWLVNTC